MGNERGPEHRPPTVNTKSGIKGFFAELALALGVEPEPEIVISDELELHFAEQKLAKAESRLAGAQRFAEERSSRVGSFLAGQLVNVLQSRVYYAHVEAEAIADRIHFPAGEYQGKQNQPNLQPPFSDN